MRRFLLTTAAVLVGANIALAVTNPTFRSEALLDHGVERYQELRTVLHDWVGESLAGARRDAEAPTATAQQQGLPAPQVERENEIAHWLLFESPGVVSVLRQDHAYEGANGSIWLVPVNWDREADALIPIESVVGEPDSDAADYGRLADMLQEATVAQVWAGNAEGWQGAIADAVRPDPTFLSTFTFVPSTEPDRIGGVAWHFEPQVVAPETRGVVTVVIPQSQLRDLVQPEWRALMAGEPAETLNARSVAPEDTLLQNALAAAHM